MAKITKFSPAICRELSDLMDSALAALGAKHGLAFRVRGGSYDSSVWTSKVEVAVVDAETGIAASKEAKAFADYQFSHGLPLEALNREFTFGSKKYILLGFNPKSPKFAFTARSVADDKIYRLTKAGVLRAFAVMNSATILAGQVMEKVNGKTAQAPAAEWAKGAKVMAKWSDGQMYKAVYLKVGVRPGFHRVKFEDGTIFGTKSLTAR